jgi:hypothetical protein
MRPLASALLAGFLLSLGWSGICVGADAKEDATAAWLAEHYTKYEGGAMGSDLEYLHFAVCRQ